MIQERVTMRADNMLRSCRARDGMSRQRDSAVRHESRRQKSLLATTPD